MTKIIIREISKYILAIIMASLVFCLCWGLIYIIGKIVMKLFGVL